MEKQVTQHDETKLNKIIYRCFASTSYRMEGKCKDKNRFSNNISQSFKNKVKESYWTTRVKTRRKKKKTLGCFRSLTSSDAWLWSRETSCCTVNISLFLSTPSVAASSLSKPGVVRRLPGESYPSTGKGIREGFVLCAHFLPTPPSSISMHLFAFPSQNYELELGALLDSGGMGKDFIYKVESIAGLKEALDETMFLIYGPDIKLLFFLYRRKTDYILCYFFSIMTNFMDLFSLHHLQK